MHSLHYVAVLADSKQEASDYARTHLSSILEGEGYPWFDWFVVGGGRFAENSSDPYDDTYLDDISHHSEPRFYAYLKQAKKYRQAALDHLKFKYKAIEKEGGDFDIKNFKLPEELDFNPSNMLLGIYAELNKMVWGDWYNNSYFYDTVEGVGVDWYLRRDLKSDNPKNWYLVPVDFHF